MNDLQIQFLNQFFDGMFGAFLDGLGHDAYDKYHATSVTDVNADVKTMSQSRNLNVVGTEAPIGWGEAYVLGYITRQKIEHYADRLVYCPDAPCRLHGVRWVGDAGLAFIVTPPAEPTGTVVKLETSFTIRQ